MALNDDNRYPGTRQSSLTWSPDADGTYVVQVAAYYRNPLLSDGNLLYSQPSACDEVETPTADPNVLPSINAECAEQTVEYGFGVILQWPQELLASQTYTWSTIGQTSEVGPRCGCLACLLPPHGSNPSRCPTAGPATRFNSHEGRFLLVRLAPPL